MSTRNILGENFNSALNKIEDVMNRNNRKANKILLNRREKKKL